MNFFPWRKMYLYDGIERTIINYINVRNLNHRQGSLCQMTAYFNPFIPNGFDNIYLVCHTSIFQYIFKKATNTCGYVCVQSCVRYVYVRFRYNDLCSKKIKYYLNNLQIVAKKSWHKLMTALDGEHVLIVQCRNELRLWP